MDLDGKIEKVIWPRDGQVTWSACLYSFFTKMLNLYQSFGRGNMKQWDQAKFYCFIPSPNGWPIQNDRQNP
jgi:hypothetical protein